MRGEQKIVFPSPYLRGLRHFTGSSAKCTGFTRQTSEVTSHTSTFVSRHSRHVHALFLDGLRARSRESKMERIICSARRFILLFLFFIAARHVQFCCLIFIGAIIYRSTDSCVVPRDMDAIAIDGFIDLIVGRAEGKRIYLVVASAEFEAAFARRASTDTYGAWNIHDTFAAPIRCRTYAVRRFVSVSWYPHAGHHWVICLAGLLFENNANEST